VPEPRTEAAGLKITPWSNKREWPVVTDSAGKELWKVEPELEELKSVSFDRDGVYVVAIGYNKERPSQTNVAMLYDAKTGKPKAGLLRLTGQSEPADFATFSEDRRLVAIVSAQRIVLWDVTRPAPWVPFRQFDQKSRGFIEVSISPDNQLLLARNSDRELILWDIPSGRQLTDTQVAPEGVATQNGSDYSQTWHLLGSLDGAPNWLSELAEAVGGFTLDESGIVPRVSKDRSLALRNMQEKLSRQSGDDLYTTFGRWFFQDRISRNISPLVKVP
jgi:hypothetical protein